MKIELSQGEIAAVLRALDLYVVSGADDGYRAYAGDLAKVIRARWNEGRPADEWSEPQ